MASFNKVILLGNLTRDPTVRYTPGGRPVAELGIACTRKWFDKQANEHKEETVFLDVMFWGRTAEVAGEFLAKGRPVLVEGFLQLDTWNDKTTGEKRAKLRVVGENLQMLGHGKPKPQNSDSTNSSTPEAKGDGPAYTESGDVPF